MKFTSWKEDEAGVIHCTTDLNADIVLIAQADEAALVERVATRWGDLCRVIGGRFGVPADWLLAMIVRESGGNPNVVSFDGGVGLLQITNVALKGGHSDEQLKDPQLNLEIGARYIAELRKRHGDDFPKISAAYNAGSVRPGPDPWGMHATGDHVSVEVRALNYLRMRPLPQAERDRLLGLVAVTSADAVADVIDPLREPRDTDPAPPPEPDSIAELPTRPGG